MNHVDMLIIGGGSAAMSAALSARKKGIMDILMLERSEELGGILQQCIHNGFGLQVFKEEMSGPFYAQRYIEQIERNNIAYRLNTTVLEVTQQREVLYSNEEEGYVWVSAGVIIFASGCYERNRGAIQIPGKRLPGVYTAGSAQRFLNIENIRVGKKVFILGSGDIGLIMARRMCLEGADVVGVAEIMPYSNGLTRNVVQCLQDFHIPLYLSHTIIDIQGDKHVERVCIAQVDEHRNILKGSEKVFNVDTLLLSIGLIPENELGIQAGMLIDPKSKGAIVNEYFETSVPHIYACGNALHVHDIVDYVSMEAAQAGACAADDLLYHQRGKREIEVIAGDHVTYVIPHWIEKDVQGDVTFCFRSNVSMKHVQIVIRDPNHIIKTIKKRCILPAEMERITIKKQDLVGIDSSLMVEVKSL